MSGHKKVPFAECSGPNLADRITAFLRKVHPTKSADNVAADTGLSVNTVRKWFSREATPNAYAVMLLIGAYGPELLCAALTNPPAWLDKAARERDIAEYDAKIAALQQAREARL